MSHESGSKTKLPKVWTQLSITAALEQQLAPFIKHVCQVQYGNGQQISSKANCIKDTPTKQNKKAVFKNQL